MTGPRKGKAKAAAMTAVPQSREEAAAAVGRAGEVMRAIAARQAAADEARRAIGEALERDLAQPLAELDDLRRGIQSWCEAHREALTQGGRVKSHEFGTGRIGWRARPPKVGLRQVEAVIEAVQRLGLTRFLRTKVEVNKEAMLAEPETARTIAGVTVSSEGEDFFIEPAEVEVSR